jgi:hypothetical protein
MPRALPDTIFSYRIYGALEAALCVTPLADQRRVRLGVLAWAGYQRKESPACWIT